MSKRVWNFNPGPAALPLPALERARDEFLSFRGTGMSVLEVSHRSAEYEGVHNEVQKRLRDLLRIPDEYAILFCGGGANLQFHMVPLNLLGKDQVADYIDSGYWSSRAIAEAQKVGRVAIAASTKSENYARVPRRGEFKLTPGAAYVHLTSNNTIYGTQWSQFPADIAAPLVGDMSSDILSRPFDVAPFGCIYAGAQKNLGPAGVTVVILRRDLVGKAPAGTPAMLDYAVYAKENSLYNTPPCFAIYMMDLVLEWVQEQGGLEEIARRNEQKATILYGAIDGSDGYYRGTVVRESRSRMNVPFRLGSEELEKAFLKEAAARDMIGLKGHRAVGGIRASLYNAVPLEAVERLVELMGDFQKKNR